MKKYKCFYSLLLVLIFNSPKISIAQKISSADSIVENQSREKSYGLISTDYYNDIVFLGRKSSTRAPYLSMLAGYYHTSGLFINSGISYLAASGENRVDLFSLKAGYTFYLKSFSTGISGAKYFFNNKSSTTKSGLSGNISAYVDYDFDILDVYVDGSTYFSNTTDFIVGAGVSHTFYAFNDNLKIAPSIYLNAGSQNYYSDYNNNQRFGRHMLNGVGSQSMGTGMTRASMKVLDYELSVPVSYAISKFHFSFTPVFAIPVNPATITNSLNTYKEDLSNIFFWSVGVSYKFL
jgi:hypothetical protein